MNLSDLERFNNGTTVDAAALIEAGLVPDDKQPVKILGEGAISKKLTVVAAGTASHARKDHAGRRDGRRTSRAKRSSSQAQEEVREPRGEKRSPRVAIAEEARKLPTEQTASRRRSARKAREV